MKNTILFLILIAIGLLFSVFAKTINIDPTDVDYNYLTYTLLALGLYGSVYFIDLEELREHKKAFISAITLGVFLKSIIIGTLLYLVTGHIISFLLGIIVAQIDPVSIAHLLHKRKIKRLSKDGETLLRAWSSFDDPMTVLLSLYLILPIVSSVLTNNDLSFSFQTYFLELFLNLTLATSSFTLFQIFKKQFQKTLILEYIFLACVFVIAISLKLMLGIAIIALFIRPNIQKTIDKSVSMSFYLSTILLGIFLINGISLLNGLFLAIFAVFAQITSSLLLTKNFSKKDKIYLALGQENGITSIILSIIIESFFPGTIAITAPAIFFINMMYYSLNSLADKYFEKNLSSISQND